MTPIRVEPACAATCELSWPFTLPSDGWQRIFGPELALETRQWFERAYLNVPIWL
jgi:hypothetical protein